MVVWCAWGTLISLMPWTVLVGVVGCSSEGRAGVGHDSQFISYSDTFLSHSGVALSSPVCNTGAIAGHHGRVVQLPSSYHSQSHHHQGPDMQ